MPYKSKLQKCEYNKLLLRKKRAEIYKQQDALRVVVPSHQIKNRDGTNSMFDFMPVILTKKDELTLHKLIMKKFL